MNVQRRHRIPIGVLGVIVAVVALVAGSATAWALFSSNTESATANDTAGVLPAPSIGASSSGSTVTLELDSSGGTVTPLTFTLTSNLPAGTGTGGTCPTTETSWPPPADCTFTGVTSGTYTYTFTALYNSWSASDSTTVVVGTNGGQFVGTGPATIFTNSTTNTVDYPAGTVAGDLVLVIAVNNTNQTNDGPTAAGWSLIANTTTGSPSQFGLAAWWHVAGTETSVPVALHTSASRATVWAVSYTGLAAPIAQTGMTVSGTGVAANPITPAAFSTVAPNATVITIAAVRAANTLSLSSPAGFTQDVSTSDSSNSPGRALGVASQVVPTAGAVASPTWSQTGTAAQWAYITTAFT